MTENKNGREILRQALIEARLRKVQEILDENPGEVEVPPEHFRKMEQILQYAEHKSWLRHPKLGRKRMLALLIAATMMLLGGIGVYAHKDAIVDFITEIFSRHTEASYHSIEPAADIPKWIEDEYTLSYVPEGYERSKYQSDLNSIWVQWHNSNGECIYFTQSLIDRYYLQYDNENSAAQQIQVSNYTIYYTQHDSSFDLYLWTDGSYGYELECPADMPQEEVIRMIESLTLKSP